MADLSSLLQTSPYAAGYMIAGNNDLDQKKLQELIQAQQIQNAMDQQMNPLKVQAKQLENDYSSQVKFPRGLEELTKDRFANQETGATQPGKIAATNAGNELKVGQDKEGVARLMQGKLLRIGTAVDGAPPPLRMQAFQKAMQDEGIDPSHPMAQNLTKVLASKDPSTLGKYLTNTADAFGKIAASQDVGYQGHKYTSDNSLTASKYTADKHLEGQRLLANSREAAAKARGAANDFWSNYYKQKSAVSQFNMLTSESARLAEDDPAAAEKLKAMAKEVYPRAAAEFKAKNSPKPDLEKLGIPTQASPDLPSVGGEEAVSGQGGPGAAGFTGQTKGGVKFRVVPSQ
jgi:hypothetical protein